MLVLKNILLTRPPAQNRRLSKVLRTIGHQVLEMPVIEIVPIESPTVHANLIAELPTIDDYIFVSQHAVVHGVPLLLDDRAALKGDHRVIAVGQRTASELNVHFSNVLYPDEGVGGEALMTAEEMSDMSGRKVLIVRGKNGKEWLADELRRRGAQVSYYNCYSREKPKCIKVDIRRVFNAVDLHVVFLHSSHAAENLVDSAGKGRKELLSITAIAGSNEIYTQLVDMGWKGRIEVSASPSNDDMLACFSGLELANA